MEYLIIARATLGMSDPSNCTVVTRDTAFEIDDHNISSGNNVAKQFAETLTQNKQKHS